MCGGCGPSDLVCDWFLDAVLQCEVRRLCVVPGFCIKFAVADRIAITASRLLGSVGACVILLSWQLGIVHSIGMAASRLRLKISMGEDFVLG